MRRAILISLMLLFLGSSAALATRLYTISGTVKTPDGKAISGVTMSGLPGDPVTDNKGYYKGEVPRYWFGTVTPTKEGYVFSPKSKSYSFVRSSKKQNYTGYPLTYTISGHVRTDDGKALSGVKMSGLPDNPQTDNSGYYSAEVDYGWDGTVKPEKDKYIFSPSSVSYNKVVSHMAQDYVARLPTYTISGYVETKEGDAIRDVRMAGLPGNPSTNSSGYYSAEVEHGWDGTVTPQKDGYIFDPESKSYRNVDKDKDQDYEGYRLTHTISGYVVAGGKALEGVVMSGLPGDPSTRSDGYYSAEVDHKWDGTITPQKTGYVFSPSSKTFTDVTGNRSQNFSATLLTYTISGYVETGSGAAMEGVRLSGLPGNPLTNSDGYYSATVDFGWSGTVTPQKTGYSFNPASKSFDNVSGDLKQDFTGSLLTYSISGHVLTGDGEALEGVTLSGLPGNPSTNKDGYYSATVTYGWDGSVEPGKTGYTFNPATKDYNDVTSDQNQDYTGTLLTYTISGHVLTSDDEALEGVIMDGLPGKPSTNEEGYYAATVDHGWSGTVTPDEPMYDIDPLSRKYSAVTEDQEDDYTATMIPFLLISQASFTVPSREGEQNKVEVTSNVIWSVTVEADWLFVTPLTGTGFVEMGIISAAENEEFIPRVAEIVISGDGLTETIQVTQLGAQLKLKVTQESLTLDKESGATNQIDIDSNIDWVVQEDTDWFSVSPASGNGSMQLVVTAESENNAMESRTGELTVEGAGLIHTVVVTQLGLQQTLEVMQPGSDLAAELGSTLEFEISSNLDWNIISDVEWISFDPASGTGDATITVQAESANTEDQIREAMVTISGGNIVESFSIKQRAAGTTGMDAHELGPISLYPNPAQDWIYLQSSQAIDPGTHLEVYNMSGKLVYKQVSLGMGAGEQMPLDISLYGPGLYKIILHLDEGREIRTFIKH